MNKTKNFDIIIIGSGSAGFAAASKVAQAGLRVAMVEKDRLGGDCPNRACVPTKILLRAAEFISALKVAHTFGIKVTEFNLNWQSLLAHKQKIIQELTGDRLYNILERRGISLFKGSAAFVSPTEITVNGKSLKADKFIIATGSRPAIPNIKGLKEIGFLTSEQAINLPELPTTIIILGGGPVAIEFAQIFSCFDVKVTILEAGENILAREDIEISQHLADYLKEQSIKILTQAHVFEITRAGARKAVHFIKDNRKQVIAADEILVATGRRPALSSLNLAAAGVEVDTQGIKVNQFLQTTANNIWAAGDVTGRLLYTHVATYEGNLAGYNSISEKPEAASLTVVPRATFCEPEIASVGLTETEATISGYKYQAGHLPIRYLGKSLILGERRGLIKLLTETQTGKIIGCHIIAPFASEIIHEIALAMQNGLTIDSIADTIHAYPSMAEGLAAVASEMALAKELQKAKEAA